MSYHHAMTPSLPDSGMRLAVLAIGVLGLLAYAPSLGGGFLFDDFTNLVDNAALRALGTPQRDWLAVALSSGSGELRRPLSMLSFGLDVALFGFNPFVFKLVNLLIHLANGALVFALGRQLVPRLVAPARSRSVPADAIALAAAALWLLHPLHISGVAYVIQRMNELSALFTLLGLLGYVDARTRMLRGEPGLARAIGSLLGGGLLAVLCKENGILIIAYALVIEAFAFRFEGPTTDARRRLRVAFTLLVGLPLAAIAAYLLTHPGWLLNSYTIREFTLVERVLTEARVLVHYLYWIVVPNPTAMGMYHDDLALSRSLLDPPTTVLAIGMIAALGGAAITLRRRLPGLAFAIAWFLAGHALESTVLPLELVFEHRNYLPMAGLLLGLACALGLWLVSKTPPRLAAGLAVAALLMLAGLTAWRAHQWGDPLRLALTEAKHHPDSARSVYAAARETVIDGARRGQLQAAETTALPGFRHAAMLDPVGLHAPIAALVIEARRGSVPAGAVDDLATRLRAIKTYNKANPFLDLIVSASNEPMALTASDLEKLVDAALANPRLPPKVRAMVMNNYGAWQFNIARSAQQAIALTTAAAAEDPANPYFPLNLAKIAIAVGEKERAVGYLAEARRLDVARVHAADIGTLARQLGVAAP